MNAVANPRNFAVQPGEGITRLWVCPTCENALAGACRAFGAGCRIDAELVTHRLEAAGATLLAMRIRSPAPGGVQCALPDVMQEAVTAYGYTDEIMRPAIPDAAEISMADATFTWLQLIPQQRFLVRRLVAVRSLVHPMTGRHMVSWRQLGRIVRADYHAVQGWHSQGIATIVQGLRR